MENKVNPKRGKSQKRCRIMRRQRLVQMCSKHMPVLCKKDDLQRWTANFHSTLALQMVLMSFSLLFCFLSSKLHSLVHSHCSHAPYCAGHQWQVSFKTSVLSLSCWSDILPLHRLAHQDLVALCDGFSVTRDMFVFQSHVTPQTCLRALKRNYYPLTLHNKLKAAGLSVFLACTRRHTPVPSFKCQP